MKRDKELNINGKEENGRKNEFGLDIVQMS